MTPEQRAQLQALAESLFEDMDLRWQVDRLADNLRQAVPEAGWGRQYRFSGSDPMGLADAAVCRQATGRDGPARAVPALGLLTGRPGRGRPRAGRRSYLGEDARPFARPLGPAGQGARGGRPHRAARGTLRADRPWASGKHRAAGPVRPVLQAGQGPAGAPPATTASAPATSPRARPSPTSSATPSTSTSSGRCTTPCAARGAGTPVRLSPDDFEIERTEHLTPDLDRAHGRPVAVDADAGQLPGRQEGGHGPAHAHLHPVPPRLPRPRRLLARWPARSSRRSCPRCRGTSSTGPTCSTA